MLEDVTKSGFLKSGSSLKPLSGDAGSRSYHLVEDPSGEAPQLLCLYQKEEVDSLKNFLEIHEVLRQGDLMVPQIYKVDSDRGWVLLEYLGEESLEQTFKQSPQSLETYEGVIENLVKMQKISFPQDLRFTKEKFIAELDFAVEHLSSLYSLSLESPHLDQIKKEFFSLSQILTSQKEVFCHRDFHSRNIHIKEGQAYLIDFQDARWGNIFYDLVSLIEDAYVQLAPDQKNHLIELYSIKSGKTACPDFKYLYYLQALQRSLKACGSFASLKVIKGTSRYLTYLAPSWKNLQVYLKNLDDYPAILDFVELCEKKESKYG